MRSDYENMTVKQLRQESVDRGLGLSYLRELKRAELLEALTRNDKGMTPDKPLAGWNDYGKHVGFPQ